MDVTLATIVANKLPGDSLALVLIGAPSTGRTEILRACLTHHLTYEVGEFGAGTFLSGQVARGKAGKPVEGVLDRLLRYPDAGDGMTLISLEFSQLLTTNRLMRDTVFAQLRAVVCDGRFRRNLAGVDKTWEGRLGLLGASTPALEDTLGAMAALGSRLIFYRVEVPDRMAVARRAVAVQGQEIMMRARVAEAFRAALDGVRFSSHVALPDATANRIAALADLASTSRSPVNRPAAQRQILNPPAVEGPARLAKAFTKLALAMSLLREEGQVAEDVYRIVRDIGMSTMPIARRRILETVAVQAMTQVALRDLLHIHAQNRLEDLALLGAIERRATKWYFTPRFAELWKAVHS